MIVVSSSIIFLSVLANLIARNAFGWEADIAGAIIYGTARPFIAFCALFPLDLPFPARCFSVAVFLIRAIFISSLTVLPYCLFACIPFRALLACDKASGSLLFGARLAAEQSQAFSFEDGTSVGLRARAGPVFSTKGGF